MDLKNPQLFKLKFLSKYIIFYKRKLYLCIEKYYFFLNTSSLRYIRFHSELRLSFIEEMRRRSFVILYFKISFQKRFPFLFTHFLSFEFKICEQTISSIKLRILPTFTLVQVQPVIIFSKSSKQFQDFCHPYLEVQV